MESSTMSLVDCREGEDQVKYIINIHLETVYQQQSHNNMFTGMGKLTVCKKSSNPFKLYHSTIE